MQKPSCSEQIGQSLLRETRIQEALKLTCAYDTHYLFDSNWPLIYSRNSLLLACIRAEALAVVFFTDE